MGGSRNAFLQLAVWSRLSDFCSNLTSVCLRFSLCKRLYALNCVWKRKWCNLHRTFTTKKKMSVQTSAFPQSFLSFPQTAASLDLLCVRKTEDLSIYLLSTTLVSSQKHGRIQLHGDWGASVSIIPVRYKEVQGRMCNVCICAWSGQWAMQWHQKAQWDRDGEILILVDLYENLGHTSRIRLALKMFK